MVKIKSPNKTRFSLHLCIRVHIFILDIHVLHMILELCENTYVNFKNT